MPFARGFRALAAVLAALVGCKSTLCAALLDQPAAAVGSRESPESRQPQPIEDDAQLFDLQFVGPNTGWAVGDHGVIWHTDDGGEHWRLQSSGVRWPLRGVYFINDRVGWVVGGCTQPFTHRSLGLVLKTEDAGATWQRLVDPDLGSLTRAPAVGLKAMPASDQSSKSAGPNAAQLMTLPFLHRVRFFTRQRGVAVSEPGDGLPSGLYETTDAGQSWRPLETSRVEEWLAADFIHPASGALAGVEGALGRLIAGKLEVLRPALAGARGVHDLSLIGARDGWLAGDGALLLKTQDAGRIWQAPPQNIPDQCRELFEFRALACRDGHVWVAGHPGSIVWHSADGGHSWVRQPTGQSAPLHALHFATRSSGWAAGAFGCILHTEDGGATWRPQRAGNRRLALMHIAPRAAYAAPELGAQVSAEMGYRALLLVAARDRQGIWAGRDPERRLHEAFTRAGGSAAAVWWRFPMLAPSAERDFDRLVEDWNRRNEGRLDEVMVGQFVRELRAWRPSVVILEQPGAHDAAARLVFERALTAIEQSADATRYVHQQELAGLEPWRPERVYIHLAAGGSGDVLMDQRAYLPRLGCTLAMAAGEARGLLDVGFAARRQTEAYKLMRESAGANLPAAAGGGFLAGLHLPHDSSARRPPGKIDEARAESGAKLAQRERNLAAYAQRMLADERKAAQLLAQLGESLADVPARLAAMQLAQIAGRYEAAGHWELAELALVNLVERHPKEPAALAAAQRLIQLWASDELAWRKLQQESALHQELETDPQSAHRAIARAEARLKRQSQEAGQSIFDRLQSGEQGQQPSDPAIEEPFPEDPQPGQLELGDSRLVLRQYHRQVEQLNSRALELFTRLTRQDAAAGRRPELGFPVAAIYRKRGLHERAENLFHRLAQDAGPWQRAASAQLWLASPWAEPEIAVTGCGLARRRPQLDGVLADPCWEAAEEIRLTFGPRHKEAPPALVFLCRDAQYLYWAAAVPRVAGTAEEGPTNRPRKHDEQLEGFDRLTLHLDLDGDYVTCFSFTVDQRGCTAESCCGDTSWNPKWYVAVDADQAHWRFECAIPLRELGPNTPGSGTAWAAAIVRTVPAVDLASWSHPASTVLRPEMFGLMRFE
jgi:photosystem II stability/assembly factor-like uncharacterized protein